MKIFPWLKKRKTDPELPYEPPIWFGPKWNRRYFRPATRQERLMRKLTLQRADENARRLGMDRRHFLASAMGMATTLLVINEVTAGCSSKSGSLGRSGVGDGPRDGGGGGDSGHNCVPPEAMFDEACANAIVGGKEFILDVETTWYSAEDVQNYSAYKQAYGPAFEIFTEASYIDTIFCKSDTTMTCLTAVAGISCTSTRTVGCGAPLSNDHIAASRDKINALAGNSQRVLNHVEVLPQDPSGIDVQLAIMEELYCRHGVAAWKLHPGFKPGFRFDDPNADAVVKKGLQLGVNRFCVDKDTIGNFFDPVVTSPDDIGPVAAKYPEANFIIYHSAICAGTSPCTEMEGPFDPNDTTMQLGTNALIRSVLDAGIKPGGNVYGETGKAFNDLIAQPDQAAHFFGKLLKYLGEDNVVWGTNAIVDGNPQPQIEAFRALTIPQAMMDQYGYPALTPEIKAKIFGLNSARLYGIDPVATRCQVNSCAMTELKNRLDEEKGPRRWAFDTPLGPKTRG